MQTHSHTHPPHQSSALRSSIRGWGMSGSKELRLLGNLVVHSVHSSTYTLNSSRRVPLQHARFFSLETRRIGQKSRKPDCPNRIPTGPLPCFGLWRGCRPPAVRSSWDSPQEAGGLGARGYLRPFFSSLTHMQFCRSIVYSQGQAIFCFCPAHLI